MDAVKYLKEKERMCKYYDRKCQKCTFGRYVRCVDVQNNDPEKAVEYVEAWSDGHPYRTNADKFREVFGEFVTYIWSMQEEEFFKWLNAEYIPRMDGT